MLNTRTNVPTRTPVSSRQFRRAVLPQPQVTHAKHTHQHTHNTYMDPLSIGSDLPLSQLRFSPVQPLPLTRALLPCFFFSRHLQRPLLSSPFTAAATAYITAAAAQCTSSPRTPGTLNTHTHRARTNSLARTLWQYEPGSLKPTPVCSTHREHVHPRTQNLTSLLLVDAHTTLTTCIHSCYCCSIANHNPAPPVPAILLLLLDAPCFLLHLSSIDLFHLSNHSVILLSPSPLSNSATLSHLLRPARFCSICPVLHSPSSQILLRFPLPHVVRSFLAISPLLSRLPLCSQSPKKLLQLSHLSLCLVYSAFCLKERRKRKYQTSKVTFWSLSFWKVHNSTLIFVI